MRFEAGLRDDDSGDTQALAFLAVAVAAVGVLVSIHDKLNAFWWLPGVVCALAGAFFTAAVLPRRAAPGPNPVAYHASLGAVAAQPLDAARGTLATLGDAAARDIESRAPKLNLARVGRALLFLGLLGCIPVVALGPT